MAEMVCGTVLFAGADHVDQWTKIVQLFGTPPSSFTQRLVRQLRMQMCHARVYFFCVLLYS
jgi:hypothetical protein